MVFAPLGDSAVVITLGGGVDERSLAAVSQLTAALHGAALIGVTDVVPAYDTVTVFYDSTLLAGEKETPYVRICSAIAAATRPLILINDPTANSAGTTTTEAARRREIPVCYGREYGPDLPELAAHAKLAGAEVVARHSRAHYRVQAIGFAPGFPYLSGLPPELAMPRLMTPRPRVPAGSVGIGGAQTGVYPRESPGGWRLIGRTPLKLFDVHREEPAWLRVGDVVTFHSITAEEFASWT